MQAYLLVGRSGNDAEREIVKLSLKLKAKINEFPLVKIEDVRSLNNLLRLSFTEPTLIVARDVHSATEEAMNALLKNLEEPQKNIFFALTAESVKKVLPTIVSRCLIIKITAKTSAIEDFGEYESFLNISTGNKFIFMEKFKTRQEAIEFTENLITCMHLLVKNGNKTELLIKVEAAVHTLINLKKNGNISLQLTNLVVRMESTHD